MDDQYYYLLDGKEQGPFSRAAIDSLAANGALASALLRTGSDPTWRTAEEIGLLSIKASEPPKPKPAVDKYGFPIKEESAPDGLASMKFRPRDEPKRSSFLAVIIGVVLAATAIYFLVWHERKPYKSTTSGLMATGKTWELTTGTHEFYIDPGSTNEKESRKFKIKISNGVAEIWTSGGELGSHKGWHRFRSEDDGPDLGRMISAGERDVASNSCVVWEKETQAGARSSALYSQARAKVPQSSTVLSICRAATASSWPAIMSQPGSLGLSRGTKVDRKFNVVEGQLFGIVVDAPASGFGILTFASALTLAEPKAVHASKSTERSVRRESGSVDPAKVTTEMKIEQQTTAGSECPPGSDPCEAEKSNQQAFDASLVGTYTCEANASSIGHHCNFHLSKRSLTALVGAKNAQEVQSLNFTNPDDLIRQLGLSEIGAPSGCLVGGEANVEISQHKLLDDEGGYYIEARLESATPRGEPKILAGENQLESCQLI